MNAVEIEQAISELALQPFDAAEFPFAFLAAFGNKDTALKRLRAGNNASNVPGGVLQPENLRQAHEHNDEVLERIYIGRRFKNDTERLEKLFALYTKMTAAVVKAPARPSSKNTSARKRA